MSDTMTIWAAKIGTDGTIEFLMEKPGLDVMREAIGGGWISSVNCPNGDTVYVDDEGLHKDMDPNPLAMLLTQYPGVLVGNAIMCGPLDGGGEHTPLSDKAVQFLTLG